jgi:hypothetical protein
MDSPKLRIGNNINKNAMIPISFSDNLLNMMLKKLRRIIIPIIIKIGTI